MPVVFATALVAGAPPAQAAALRPSAVTLVQSLKADVDGDGHKDRVKVYRLGAGTFNVKVSTRRKTVAKSFTTDGYVSKPLYAAGRLDGTKGYELILTTSEDEFTTCLVFTWRKGKLVTETGPVMASYGGGTTRRWGWSEGAETAAGYRFFTHRGKRYVDAAMLSEGGEEGMVGTIVRSVWKSGSWRKVRSSFVEVDWDLAPAKYAGFKNVPLIKP